MLYHSLLFLSFFPYYYFLFSFIKEIIYRIRQNKALALVFVSLYIYMYLEGPGFDPRYDALGESVFPSLLALKNKKAYE